MGSKPNNKKEEKDHDTIGKRGHSWLRRGVQNNYLESKLREKYYDMVAITETGFTKDGMAMLEGYKKIVSNSRLRDNGSTVLQAGAAVWGKADQRRGQR